MRSLSEIFGHSPFEPLVEHARKVHQCVSMVGPVAEAIIADDKKRLGELQHQMSRTEYEADQLKDRIRQRLPKRYFLPVSRGDVAKFLTEMDKIADGAKDLDEILQNGKTIFDEINKIGDIVDPKMNWLLCLHMK